MERMRARGNRPPTLSELCAESDEPVFGVAGSPAGLRPVGLSHSFDHEGKPQRITLEYEAEANTRVQVQSTGADTQGTHVLSSSGLDAPDPGVMRRQRLQLSVSGQAAMMLTRQAHEQAMSVQPATYSGAGRGVELGTFQVEPVLVARVSSADGECGVSGVGLTEADFRAVVSAVRRIDDDAAERRRHDEALAERQKSLGVGGLLIGPDEPSDR
jgi:hypothetical protein